MNVDAVVKNWIAAGLSKSKLVISVAFYARTFKLKDPNQHDIYAPADGPGPGDGILEYSEVIITKNFGFVDAVIYRNFI